MEEFRYKKLIVWQKSVELSKLIYLLTDKLPKSEEYNLKSQMRRAAISVISNIAEGSARRSDNDQKRFYMIARSSLIEIDSQIEAGIQLAYFTRIGYDSLLPIMIEIYKILSKLIAPV